MNRRTAIAWIAALFAPSAIKAADTIPVKPAMFVPTRPAEWPSAKKALQWAAMCLRQGRHWTFEGIDWMVAALPFMRSHLCRVHGHRHYEVDGLDRAQLIAWHDAHHNGTPIAGFSIPQTPLPDRHGNGAGVNRMPQYIMDTLPQQNCPNGRCPIPRRRA